MPCRAVLFALTPEHHCALLDAQGNDDAVIRLIHEDIEEIWDEAHLCELDGAWDAIHRCLDHERELNCGRAATPEGGVAPRSPPRATEIGLPISVLLGRLVATSIAGDRLAITSRSRWHDAESGLRTR